MDDTTHVDVDFGDDDPQRAVRDLLSGQPDPGLMPSAVARQIEAALQKEQQRRVSEAPTGKLSLVQAGAARPLSAPAGFPAGKFHRGDAPVVDLSSRRRGRGLRAVGIAAAVAGVVLGGGALGVAALNQQDVPVAAAPVDPVALASRVAVASTGQDYSAAALPAQAAALLTAPTSTRVSPQVAQTYGAMATSRGVVSCVGSLGTALAADPDRITVDLARYDGQPAVAVVLTKDGKSTAWVVGRKWSQASKPLAGPTTVAT